MYALYLAGPIVERWYGPLRFLAVLSRLRRGGLGRQLRVRRRRPVGRARPGAIFGLFGLLLAAGRVHHPVDRQSRRIVGQLGMLIAINIVFGFAVAGIDNAAHIGGLAAGLFLGAVVPPTRVQTMSALWQRVDEAGSGTWPGCRWSSVAAALAVVFGVVAVGLFVGTQQRIA